MPILSLLLTLAVFGVVVYLIDLLPMPAPVKQAINIVAVLIVVLWVIKALFGVGPAGLHF